MHSIGSAETKTVRKRLRLKEYDYSKNGLYFITICADKKNNCFGRITGSKNYSEKDKEIIDFVSNLTADTFVGVDAHIDPNPVCFNQYIELSGIGKIADKYIKSIPGVDCYCIMPDHIHLIINSHSENGSMWASTPTTGVSQLIKSFKILVSKEIGFSVWQRSFYDHIIRDWNDYFTKFKYIANNGLKWAEKNGIE